MPNLESWAWGLNVHVPIDFYYGSGVDVGMPIHKHTYSEHSRQYIYNTYSSNFYYLLSIVHVCRGQSGVRTEQLPDEWFDYSMAFSTVTDFYDKDENTTITAAMHNPAQNEVPPAQTAAEGMQWRVCII